MKEKMQAIADMYLQWKLITDLIQELRTCGLDNGTALRWNASVLKTRCENCINAMRKVAEMIEKEEQQ